MASQWEEGVLITTLRYILKRQIQGRRTHLRLVSKRNGTSIDNILSILDDHEIEYLLLRLGRGNRLTNTEILIQKMPEEIRERVGFEREAITDSYQRIVEEDEGLTCIQNQEATEENFLALDTIDPYVRYRITKEQFLVLERQLIPYEELEQAAKEKGYRVSAIRKAVGGDRMKYVPISPVWRPFVLGKKRYYLRDVLRYLEESDLTYKDEPTRLRIKEQRRRKMEPHRYISFSRREDIRKRVLEKEIP